MTLTVCVAAAVWGLCAAVRRRLRRGGRRERAWWGGSVRLTELWNSGAAFDLPVRRQTVAAGSLIALTAALLQGRRHPVSAGLVLGGGLSNLWERLRLGRVYDYVRFPAAPGPLGRYVFNLADFAVFLGAAGLALGGRRRRR